MNFTEIITTLKNIKSEPEYYSFLGNIANSLSEEYCGSIITDELLKRLSTLICDIHQKAIEYHIVTKFKEVELIHSNTEPDILRIVLYDGNWKKEDFLPLQTKFSLTLPEEEPSYTKEDNIYADIDEINNEEK